MKYEDLKFERKAYGRAFQACHTFDNGYGISVITDGYGSERGLLELAIIADGELCYDTPITDDVLGCLTHAEVEEAMAKVAALPKREPVTNGAA